MDYKCSDEGNNGKDGPKAKGYNKNPCIVLAPVFRIGVHDFE